VIKRDLDKKNVEEFIEKPIKMKRILQRSYYQSGFLFHSMCRINHWEEIALAKK
jgi:hypothetical protein